MHDDIVQFKYQKYTERQYLCREFKIFNSESESDSCGQYKLSLFHCISKILTINWHKNPMQTVREKC